MPYKPSLRLLLLASAITAALGGCIDMAAVGGTSQFGCKAPEGVHCMSVSGVYANAIQKNLPAQQRGTGLRSASGRPASQAGDLSPVAYHPGGAASPIVFTEAASESTAPLRSQQRVLRLWVKPWEDTDGDLIDQGYVYVTVDTGRWLIDARQREIRNAYAPKRASHAAPPIAGDSAPHAEPAANAITPAAPATATALPAQAGPVTPVDSSTRLQAAIKAAQAAQQAHLNEGATDAK